MKQQHYITILGRNFTIGFDSIGVIAKILSSPKTADIKIDKNSRQLIIHPIKKGRETVQFLNEQNENISINVSVFLDKEAFLITALSCNYHSGWDPSLHDRFPHRQCCGPDKNGNAFIHVLNMEKILHKNNLPITWMIDPKTAEDNKNFFIKCRENFCDEFALMPSSFSHFNSINFNIDKKYEETLELCKNGRDELEKIFGLKISSLAIDQFIGSVGTNFTNAASELGLDALWGMGFDHGTCDTSMFHYGCPWNVYRPSHNNFRIPGKNPHNLWMFQWTFRDLINTVNVPGGASGAVMFSTDVDDIVCTNLAKNQKDYYHRLVNEFLKNKDHNDMLEVTIHQEDHDSWHKEGLDYYDNFYSNLPDGLTPATMGEVAQWLNIKYPYPREPKQCVKLNEPITCKKDVEFVHHDVKKPSNWHDNNEKYPQHIFYYDRDYQFVFLENSHSPLRFIDYTKNYAVAENGFYPAENLPEININKLISKTDENNFIIEYDIISSGDYQGYPIAIRTESKPPKDTIKIIGGFVIFFNFVQGINNGKICLPNNI